MSLELDHASRTHVTVLCADGYSGLSIQEFGSGWNRAAREALSRYLQLENYVNSWRREGFGDDDLAGGGSARFLDAMVAWGDERTIRARIQEHWDAGADHVCIQPISLQGSRQIVDDRILDLLAPAHRS